MRPSTLVVFDGQSYAYASPPNTFPAQTMAGRGLPYSIVAESGKSFSFLSTSYGYRSAFTQSRAYESSVLVLSGGQSDLNPSQDNDTGEKALADMEAYADLARAQGGYDKIIALTLNDTNLFTGADEQTQLATLNAGIRSSSRWEYVADIHADPTIGTNYNNTTYYYDGLHWTEAGNAIAAGIIGEQLDLALAAIDTG